MSPPSKVYLPRTTEDVVLAVREAKALGQALTVRGGDPSRPAPERAEGGALLFTRALDRIVDLDESCLSVTVEAGAELASVDAYLTERGFGLPVGAGATSVTAGGFASVGGVSPASVRHGLFIDNVRELDCVTWDGEPRRCGRAHAPELFRRLLGGAGREGVITRLVLDILPLDKQGTVLEGVSASARDLERFIARTTPLLEAPDGARMAFGAYAEVSVRGRPLGFGCFSSYRDTAPRAWKALAGKVARGSSRGLGLLSGRLPRRLDPLRASLDLAGGLLPPRHASLQDVEALAGGRFGEAADASSRGLLVFVPLAGYGALLRELFALFREVRERAGGIPFLHVAVMPVRSGTLGQGDPEQRFCALRFHPGMALDRSGSGLEARVDALCARYGASRTLRREVDLSSRGAQHPAVEPRGLRAVD